MQFHEDDFTKQEQHQIDRNLTATQITMSSNNNDVIY